MTKADKMQQLSLELPDPVGPQVTNSELKRNQCVPEVVCLSKIRESRVLSAIEERVRKAAIFA